MPGVTDLAALIGYHVDGIMQAMDERDSNEASTSSSNPQFSVGGSRSSLTPQLVTIVVVGLTEVRSTLPDLLTKQMEERGYALATAVYSRLVDETFVMYFTIQV